MGAYNHSLTNLIYLNQPSTDALQQHLLYGSCFSVPNWVEDHSVGRRDETSLLLQSGDSVSMQSIGRQHTSTVPLSDCNTFAVDPQIFPQKVLDDRYEGFQSQGLSLSLGTQIPSSAHMSSYQKHYTSPRLSSMMNSSFLNAHEQGSQNNKGGDSEYLSFDIAGSTSDTAAIEAVGNHPFSVNSKLNPSSHWDEPHSVSGNIYNSKYFKAAQDLLDELVNVHGAFKQSYKCQNFHSCGENVSDEIDLKSKRHLKLASNRRLSDSKDSASDLSSSERKDLRSKVSKLWSMLEEVDRRYREYYQQIQVLVSSFEIVAGRGAAKPYTTLAVQTISRQFRRLHDAIKEQIQVTQQCLGEEGETTNNQATGLPRLRYIDQKLRQQRALQQFGIIRQPWRPQKGLPETAVSILRAWLFENFLHPYPKDSEKILLAKQAGLTRNQVANWFINARVRLWKPMIENMYKEEFGDREVDSGSSPDHAQTQSMELSTLENKLDSVQESSKFKSLEHDNLEQSNKLASDADADMNVRKRLNLENGSRDVDESSFKRVNLIGDDNFKLADAAGPNDIASDSQIGNADSIAATNSYHVSLLECSAGNQVSLALGLQQGGNEHNPTSSGNQLKDYNPGGTSSADLSKEYCYMEPLNQQDRFANQHLFSDFII